MRQSFYKDTTVYLLGSSFGALLGLVSIPVYTRYVSPADYGIFALFILIGTFSANLISLVLSQAVYRFYFDHQDNPEAFSRILSSIFIFNVLCFAIALAILFPFSTFFADLLFSDSGYQCLFKLALISGVIGYCITSLTNLLVAEVRPILFSSVNAARSLTTLIATIALLNIDGASHEDLIYGFMLSQLFALSWLIFVYRSLFRLTFDTKIISAALRYAAPLVGRFVVASVNSSVDRIMLTNMSGLQSVGQYSLGAKVSEIFKLTADALDKRWNSYFLSEAGSKDPDSRKLMARRYTELQLILVVLGFGLITYSEEVVMLLTTKEFYSMMYILPLFVCYHIINILSMMTVPQLQYAKKTKFLFVAAIVGSVVNLLLNFLLIPSFAVYGAAIALIISALAINTVFLYYGNRAAPIDINISRMLAILGLPIFMTPVVYGIMFLEATLSVKLLLKSALFLFTCVIAFRIAKLSPSELYRAVTGEGDVKPKVF